MFKKTFDFLAVQKKRIEVFSELGWLLERKTCKHASSLVSWASVEMPWMLLVWLCYVSKGYCWNCSSARKKWAFLRYIRQIVSLFMMVADMASVCPARKVLLCGSLHNKLFLCVGVASCQLFMVMDLRTVTIYLDPHKKSEWFWKILLCNTFASNISVRGVIFLRKE